MYQKEKLGKTQAENWKSWEASADEEGLTSQAKLL